MINQMKILWVHFEVGKYVINKYFKAITSTTAGLK
jgi:hypothetical protein